MVIRNFNEILSRLQNKDPRRMAVAVAEDDHTLEAVVEAAAKGIVWPILVGDIHKMNQVLKKLNCDEPFEKIDEPDSAEACRKAVALVKEDKADFLMKGKVDTSVLLKAVVNKENGLGQGKLMSHFGLFELPGYHKLVAIVDGGMIPYPTLEDKKGIIENTVNVFHKLGYEEPKVAVLSCVEKVNPKMPETVDGDTLKKMNQNGEIRGCIVEGPMAYDIALCEEAVYIKGYESPVAADADILLASNIHMGNTLAKALIWHGHARIAGFVVGAKCPIVLTSRASSADEKFMSIVVSAVVSGGK